MSDYEIIMLHLQVLAVVIAFGALVALICLTKSKQPSVAQCNQITERPFPNLFFQFRDAPDGSTRLAIYLYYKDKDIYRQIEINRRSL